MSFSPIGACVTGQSRGIGQCLYPVTSVLINFGWAAPNRASLCMRCNVADVNSQINDRYCSNN